MLFKRQARGLPVGGEFAPHGRPDGEVRLTRAERERVGLDPRQVLTLTVLDRCPDAVAWSVPVGLDLDGEPVAGGPITVEFPSGDTVEFDAAPGDLDDAFISDAIRDLADSVEAGEGRYRVDVVDRREVAFSWPEAV